MSDHRFDDRPCAVRKTKKNNAWKLDELKILARASGMPKYTTFKTKRELCKALGRKNSDVVLTRTKTKKNRVKATSVPIGQEGAKLKKVRESKKKTVAKKADLFGPTLRSLVYHSCRTRQRWQRGSLARASEGSSCTLEWAQERP